MIRDFISLIFPVSCVGCNQSLISEEKIVCTACKVDLPRTNDHQNKSNDLLKKFAFEPKIKSASSFLHFNHRGIAQTLLHNLKYKGRGEIGNLLGEWMSETLNDLDIDEIIPVPLHHQKLQRRGYNQSEKIAEGISDQLKISINTNCISRLVNTQSQTRKSKVSRWSNMNNVFSKPQVSLSGKSILVVDDVITTGATVGMLCERLVEGDVKEIHITSVARGK
ncbi:ComF family protein [Ekhidna sp.]|uniref:ComF family protein n=1 Tax=Ekhidna sp. TaxID=2608089 RepID=UPI003B5143D5